MSNLFDFVQISPVSGDCTCNYRLRFNKVCTIKDFVTDIFNSRGNEWGSIEVRPNIAVEGIINNVVSTQYEHGTFRNSSFTDVYDFIITEATASGGWTRMDYVLYAKPNTESKVDGKEEPTIMENCNKDYMLSNDFVVYSKWKINCDGYYPYCAYCGEEPKGGMSKYCPNCGAKMCLED